MKKIIYSISLTISSIVMGQVSANNAQLPNISPPPPDIHSLYKFIEIPVSNTTGVPNINVPMHEVRLRDFTLPITINYHSSGIIIDEIASNVGLGWSLSAGGIISQITVGKPDFGNGITIPQDHALDDAYIPYSNNNEYYILKDLSASNSEQGGMDTEPDAYMFNAGSLNGKFFFDTEGNAHTIPKSDIKIFRNNPVDYKITDEKGNNYYFQTLSANTNYTYLEYSSNGLGGSSHATNYSLYLTKIETINNEKIVFEYNTISYKYRNPNYLKRSKRPYDTTGLVECTSTLGSTNSGYLNQLNSWRGFEFEKNEMYSNYVEVNIGKSLSKIIVNNNEQIIEFQYANCPRLDLPSEPLTGNRITTGSFALKSIKVKNTFSQTVDNFDFIHEYFNLTNYQECATNSNSITRDSYRLKLKEIIKNNIEKHRFEYFENELLPNRLSKFYDHWNRFKTNIIGDGDYVLDYSYSFLDGVDRTPHLASSQLGTLKKIVYPTKGYSEFVYGLNKTFGNYKLYNPPAKHDVSIFLHGTEELGIPNEEQHLTLPFIINNLAHDEDGLEIKPTIQVYSPPINVQTGFTTDNFYIFYLVNNDNQGQVPTFMYGDQNGLIQTLNLSNGSYTLHIIGKYEGLGAVINWLEQTHQEEITKNIDIGGLRIEQINNINRNNTVETKKMYNYHLNNEPSKSSGIIMNFPVYTYNENKYRVCSVVSQTLPFTGATQQLTSFLKYVYKTQQNKPYFPMNILNGYHIMYPEVQIFNEDDKLNGYTIFKYSFLQDDLSYSVNSGIFSAENFICPPTSLDFLRGDLIEKMDYKKSNNSFIKVAECKYDYFHDDSGSFFNDPNNFRIGLKLEEFFRETSVMRMNNNGPFLDQKFPSLFNLGYYKYQSIRKYLSKATETIYSSNGNNPITTITEYKHENSIHNQLTNKTTTNSNGDTLKTNYFYAHDLNKQSLINKNMIGVLLKTETYKNNEKLFTLETIYKNWDNNGLLLPEIIQTGKGYEPLEVRIRYNNVDLINGNPQEVQQENGTKVCYIWGYNKTQPVAKIENIAYTSIPANLITDIQTASNTGTEASLLEALNNLRNAPSLINAMATTYTYKPLIGVSTITDPKGDKINYHYDSYNRLQKVTDKAGNILSENQYHYRN